VPNLAAVLPRERITAATLPSASTSLAIVTVHPATASPQPGPATRPPARRCGDSNTSVHAARAPVAPVRATTWPSLCRVGHWCQQRDQPLPCEAPEAAALRVQMALAGAVEPPQQEQHAFDDQGRPAAAKREPESPSRSLAAAAVKAVCALLVHRFVRAAAARRGDAPGPIRMGYVPAPCGAPSNAGSRSEAAETSEHGERRRTTISGSVACVKYTQRCRDSGPD